MVRQAAVIAPPTRGLPAPEDNGTAPGICCGILARPTPAAIGAFISANAHRCFFTAGIAVVLTAGAAWGAYLLWRIGTASSFTGVPIHQVNAHGHAQVFGWVGLFVLGFGYRMLPGLWGARLALPGLVPPVLLAMLAGIALSVAGEGGAGAWGSARTAAAVGGTLEAAASVIFALQMALTFRRGKGVLEPWSGFVLAGIGWFVVMAGLSAWYTDATLAAASRDELLAYVSTYQAVLRNAQVHGLALFMILGMSLRLLPAFFGTPRTPDRRAWWGFWLLLTAAAGESLSFLAFRWTGSHGYAGLMYSAWLLFPVSLALVAAPWRLWRPLPRIDRSTKFVRAAYAWLAVSVALMLLMPLYQAASGLAFSHAYYGAIRHAMTVGFVSLMIMGMSSRVVPVLRGSGSPTLRGLWVPFVLVNTGCLMRVSLQILTDWHSAPFGMIGVSGLLELTGLTLWGLPMLVRLHRRGPGRAACGEAAAA